VIDAAANCTAMVHLPGKHALSCVMRNAAAMRGERSTQLRGNHASCRTLPSMPAPRTVSTAPRAAESTIDRRNFCARIWCAGDVYEMRDKCSDNRGARCAICRKSFRGRLDPRRRAALFAAIHEAAAAALRADTLGAAYASRVDAEEGSIAVGKRADMGAFSPNFLEPPAAAIQDARAVLTIVGGKIVCEGR
jgi:hypothetical protein